MFDQMEFSNPKLFSQLVDGKQAITEQQRQQLLMKVKQQTNYFQFQEMRQMSKLKSKSQYAGQYTELFKTYFGNIKNDTVSKQLDNLLEKHSIIRRKDKFQDFSISIVKHSPNYEIVEIEIKWGYYYLKAAVVNIIGQSIFHCYRSSSSNEDTHIYHIDEDNRSFSVKCTKAKAQKQMNSILRFRAFKEYFISRIAFALGVGPALPRSLLGFDLIYSKNCIQFPMQTCRKINNLQAIGIQELKKSILSLHLMNIVHFDIKPDNIMWSNTFKKVVFIDFGLSDIIDGGPGFKYVTNYRGTPNYSSNQMTQLLIKSQIGQVDIYYNDVCCLQQTIKYLTNYSERFQEDMSVMIDNTLQFIKEYESQTINQKLWLKIVQLKMFIYAYQYQRINLLSHQEEYRSLLSEGKILDFIIVNFSVFYLKEFYQKYIPDSIKDSIQNRWIENWTKSAYPKQVALQPVKQQYFSVYQSLKNLSKENIKQLDNFTKVQIQSILLADKIEEMQLYFCCFQIYISFINNKHKVTVDEKMKCCKVFIKLLLPYSQLSQISNQQPIKQKLLSYYIIEICKFIFTYFISSEIKNSEGFIGKSKRLQLMLNLLEHIFFFALLPTQQIIALLDQIYSMTFWSQLDKFQIILAVLNRNCWNLVSLFSEASISFQKVKQWHENKLQELGQELLQPRCLYIYDSFKQQTKESYSHILLDTKFKELPQMLKMQFLLIKVSKQLLVLKEPRILQISKFISENFPKFQRDRILSIYFHFFGMFNIGYGNMEQCELICEIFKRNLYSNYLFQKLIFKRISRLHLIQKIDDRLHQIIHLTKIINPQNAGFLVQVLFRQERIIFQAINISRRQNFASQKLQVINGFERVAQKLDFRRLLNQKKHISQDLTDELVFYYFMLKCRIYFLNRQPGSLFSEEVQELILIAQQTSCCQKCQGLLNFQLIRIKLYRILFKDQRTLQINIGYYRRLINVLTKFPLVPRYIYPQQIDDSHLPKIIYQFYQYSKQNNQIEIYMDAISIPKFIQITQRLIGVDLLPKNDNKISAIYRKYYQPQIDDIKLQFFLFEPNHIACLIDSRANSQRCQQVDEQIGIYCLHLLCLYYFSWTTSRNILISQKNMSADKPAKILFYFQVLIYQFVIRNPKYLFNKAFDKFQSDKFQRREQRKKQMMRNKSVKLLYSNYKDHYNINKKERKAKANQCQELQMLFQKCQKLGSYSFFDHPKFVIRLKINKK